MSRVLPEQDIDFGLVVLLDIQPILIHLDRMAPSKLKELKDFLNDFLDKGFIN